ncbi:NF-kappa-B inhibitor cactus isoform X2 [Apis cerana]|uniref:NF-kappa-B inhibitor cactus isoform X2 n=1 Tax=Apis cerana TaxID=7461 RepID=UPI002B22D539|nr:NF-kappa-B inhibitor cactus isoform X2 [Apis cerana]XP_061939195.1 NF-kappa-B inhibitor cactus isoform X2 [Apis cerana]XP_061939256.1 NF-kappa-B inhibitor cactus isoform X2 [Apis cerana]XP_061939296.1 NF-kappa-B inhibitor cactus isoform X2 [Apis cerana]XP_061939361.1 NF-kappa-B inhibitor cactus isoform X2 [Apis cerana]XP_061939406.1 NF-kappa-B inhibitor cactus isoform X2 [Apis cerana]
MESRSTMTKNQGNGSSTRGRVCLTGGNKYTGETMLQRVSTVQRNIIGQNNSRPSQEDNWQVNGVQTARLKCSSLAKGNSCPVNQYSIVASRGDLARNNCTARETPAPCIVDKRNKATVNASTRAKHRDNLPLKGDIPCERLAKDAEGPATDLRKAQRPIRKSFSVPDYLREDRSVREVDIVAKVPSSWEETSEGPAALLRAARDADDAVLNEIAVQVRKFGFGSMDVNMADSSGRTAISYMAGNGASTMLELALSFERADPNIPDNEGNTPLHFAAQAGQTECLNILLQRCPEIEVDARNASGFTPLMKAALQGRTKCAKILLFAGANPTLRDHGRGLRAEQWARFCGRYVCAEVIERFARHRLLERSTSCRWGSEPELAAKVLQGKVVPIPATPLSSSSSGLKSKIRKVFRTTSGPDRNFSLVSQLTSAALCASSPALPKSSDVPPVVKSLLRPLSVPQLRVTLVSPQDFIEQSKDKYGSNFTEKIENAVAKPSRSKKKNK